ncbi:MAG TPA: S8 family serine peptidase [Fimbriimonadaceae bacterium]|nr:S8 family serine peptidase [Fimbriimonadaceae bacterium]HRJ32787.1 S8 family serine peptidase [Fimbriimonadaceae bacterium]
MSQDNISTVGPASGRRSWWGALAVVALGLVGTFGTASAQSGNNDAELRRLALVYSQQATADYQQAVAWATFNNWPIEHTLPNGSLARIVAVRNGKPIYHVMRDLQTAATITANAVWPGGSLGLSLTGVNTRLGIWDDGLPTHPEFGNRVTSPDNTTQPGFHSTGVAGMMAAGGVNPTARGMAYQSRIDAYNTNNNYSEIATAATNGLRFSNHSYGAAFGWVFGGAGDNRWAWFGDPAVSQTIDWQWGAYLEGSRIYDNIAFNAPMHLMVMAIGNQRGDGPAAGTEHWVWQNNNWTLSTTTRERNGGTTGFDSTPGDTTSKNILVVSACFPLPGGYTGPGSIVPVGFSCWGPTDDGRIKPDVTAPGINLFLPVVGGGYENGGGGTSYSSPAVAGALGLLNDYYRLIKGQDMSSAMARGLVAISANEAGPAPGPDYMFGWGVMNTEGAAKMIGAGSNVLEMRTLTQGQTLNIPMPIAKSGPVRVAISWTDPAGTTSTPALNNTAAKLVNDLDVRLIRESDQTVFQPWTLGGVTNPGAAATPGDNTVDNVEVIQINNAVPGNYTLRITHKGANLAPSGSQAFALIVDRPASDGIRDFVIDPADTVGGTVLNAQLSLIKPAEEDTPVTISTSNSSVITLPPNLVIQAGKDSITFDIPTRTVSRTTTATINVIAAGDSKAQQITLRPMGVGSVSVNPISVVGGTNVTGTVTLNSPAPPGGASVNLLTSNSSAARTTRNWILIPEGATEGIFAITTSPVLNSADVVVTAFRGETSATAPLGVRAPGLLATTPLSATVRSRGSVRLNFALDGVAPSAGAFIALASNNRSVISTPAGVSIARGLRTGSVTLTAGSVNRNTTVRIRVTRLNVTQDVVLTVTP